jgi:hypothetical protein
MTEAIQINKIASETISVPIVGTMPLIVHNFSEKSKRQMLDAQQGRKSPKQVRDPEAEYEAAFYRTKDGYGFPVTAFNDFARQLVLKDMEREWQALRRRYEHFEEFLAMVLRDTEAA